MGYVVVLFSLCWWRLDGVFGESLSVTEGDSVTLNTSLTEMVDDDLIYWTFMKENTLIAEIDVKGDSATVHDDVLDGRFRNRMKLNDQTGSLTITNTTTEHTGDYQLKVMRRGNKNFSLTVYATLPVPVISRECSSFSSSSNCSVVCSVVNVSHVTLSWLKGNCLLSSISVSDLSISLSLPLEVEDQDTNNYSCVLNNSITHQTTHLDISGVCHTCEVSVFRIILISSAGFLLIVAALGILCICKKCRKTEKVNTVKTHEDEITYVEPAFYKRKAVQSKSKEEDRVEYAPIAIKLQSS